MAMTKTGEINLDVALEQFKKRKTANAKKKQINNARLPAGSSMYYYCHYCGEHTETLPESHTSTPKTVCDPCKILADHGMVPISD